MKIFIKLLIAALVLNACIRVGESAWRHYQFEDRVEHETRYGNIKTSSDLRRRLVQVAYDNGVPLDEGDVVVGRRGLDTVVALTYVDAILLIPGVYTHQQVYEVAITVQPLRPLIMDEKK